MFALGLPNLFLFIICLPYISISISLNSYVEKKSVTKRESRTVFRNAIELGHP